MNEKTEEGGGNGGDDKTETNLSGVGANGIFGGGGSFAQIDLAETTLA